jgi:hypothetical protein
VIDYTSPAVIEARAAAKAKQRAAQVVGNPPFKSTRQGVIDYTSPAVMRARAAAKKKQRAAQSAGAYVLGEWRQDAAGVLFLACVEMLPGYRIDPDAPLTPSVRRAWRWRTKQACHQFRGFHPQLADLVVVNVDALIARGRRGRRAARAAGRSGDLRGVNAAA